LWLLTLWIVLSVIGCLLVALALGPHLPRPRVEHGGEPADRLHRPCHARHPVVVGVLLYFGWALAFWRQKPGDETDAAPLHGNAKVQVTWIAGTPRSCSASRLRHDRADRPRGRRAGQGPQPIFNNGIPPTASVTSWSPNSDNVLQVQVIGQQWAWTYRYPQFGGFETTQLALPVNQPVQFNITSLDVIHSFWPYTLGVKADANPGVKQRRIHHPEDGGLLPGPVRRAVRHLARLDVRLRPGHDRLGLHGVDEDVRREAGGVTKILPPYALTYDPTSIPAGRSTRHSA